MKHALIPATSLIILLWVSTGSFGYGQQTTPAFRLPEYYGTYVVSAGKVLSLESPKDFPTTKVRVGIRSNAMAVCAHGAPMMQGTQDIDIPVMNPDSQFLVFLQLTGNITPMVIAQDMKLTNVAYVRNILIKNCPSPGMVRQGPENAWDALIDQVEMRVKPVPGQQEMVLSVPVAHLAPGYYVLSGGALKRNVVFMVEPVAEAIRTRCADLSVEYNAFMFNTGGEINGNTIPCGSVGSSPGDSGNGTTSASGGDTSAPAANAWTDPGTNLIWTNRDNNADLDFDQAVGYCKNLALGGFSDWRLPSIDELNGLYDPSARVPVNRPDLVALNIPGIPSPARIKGDITISGLEISGSGKPPADLQTFDFGTGKVKTVKSNKKHPFVRALCVRNPALARSTTPPIPIAKSLCDQATPTAYTVLANGHLYKVKVLGPAGPQEKVFFFDEKGSQVTDSKLLAQLSSAVWTYDNVVSSLDARAGSTRVSGILSTSKALQSYDKVQDLLARSMVEALEGVATDGATLSKAVPNLTVGILKSQLLTAPKTILILVAQRGLEESLAKYHQMEALLPPQDANALNATDLAQVKVLYLQARTLELPYEALAVKLMPTQASDLTAAALKSAMSEITSGPLFSGSTSSAVTLQSLLALEKSLTNLAKSLPAFEGYSQNLQLALNLTLANEGTITKWAVGSSQPCGAAQASRALGILSLEAAVNQGSTSFRGLSEESSIGRR